MIKIWVQLSLYDRMNTRYQIAVANLQPRLDCMKHCAWSVHEHERVLIGLSVMSM
jgi:hypothetical protein